MSDFSRDSSPDPIILPSSPLSGRTPNNVRSTRKSSPSKRNARASPSKSMTLDTPHAGEASPWRIKVTVQAEPRDGSPGKKTTTTMTLPLESPKKGRRSSSPTKKPTPAKKRGRKRKGSPIKDPRSAPQLRAQEDVQAELDWKPAMVQDDLPPPSQTPPRRASGRLARLSAQWSNGTGRTRRLTMAREELDQALQDAMGPGCERLGDMTLSRAEDFTMISVESLHSAKEASLAHISQLHAERSKSERSGLSVSYLPSSPPKSQYPDISATAAKARSSLGSPFEPTPSKRTSLSVPFSVKNSAKGKSSLRHDVDAMSWKPTGLAKLRPSSSAEEVQSAQALESRWREQRQAVSQQISNADSDDVVVVNDDGSESEDDLNAANAVQDDLWQDEASQPATGNPSNDEREERVDPDFRPTHSPSEAEDPNYKPPSSQTRSHKFEDLFAHLPEKPLRPKIPKTWRRTSGMDFSYVDSPAHQPPGETIEHRRPSADGSGVLTPPSTDESEQGDEEEEDNVAADSQGEADDQLRSEYTPSEQEEEEDDVGSGELQNEVDNQLQSEFTQPEAEATRFHQDDYDDHEMIDDEEEASRNDSKDPLDESTAGGARTGPDQQALAESFTDNTSQAHLKDKPKRRPARKPTMDLDELLDLKSSPQKARPQQQPSEHSSAKKNASPDQLSSSSKLKNSQSNIFTTNDAFNSVRTDDLLTNPPVSRHLKELRDSGVKQFSESGQYPDAEPVKAQPAVGQAQPKRRGRQYFGRNHPNNTQSTVTDSFASTGSIQMPAHPQVQIQIQTAQSQLRSRDTAQAFRKPAVAVERAMSNHSREMNNVRQQSQHDPAHPKIPAPHHDEDFDAGEDHQHSRSMHVDTYDEEEDVDEEDEQDEAADPTRSYQENLNLDSPTKIKINFGDSSTRDASWLSPANRRPPLFETQQTYAPAPSHPQPQSTSHSNSTSATAPNPKPSTSSLLSRLSTTLWSTLTRPSQPLEQLPTPHPKPSDTPLPFPPTLRSQIRSRYGILSDSHPWTMSHMRTLHRMLNSTLSGRRDSLIPTSGPLPTILKNHLSTPKISISGHEFSFTTQHAHVISTFLHTLVSQSTIDRGDVECLGDAVARLCRGYYDPVRHGEDPVYSERECEVGVGRKIEVGFVIRALGDCVRANEVLRKRLEEEELGGRSRVG